MTEHAELAFGAQAKNAVLALAMPVGLQYRSGMSLLKHFREQAGLTQSELGDAVGTSQAQIAKLEAGKRELTKVWAERLAKPLKVAAHQLLFDDDTVARPKPEPARVALGEEFPPDPDFEDTPTIGAETGRQGIPSHGIAEVDVTAGLGAGGIAMISEATSARGARFAAEVVRDYWVIPSWMLSRLGVKPEHAAAFPMQGDSMEPTLFAGEVGFLDLRHRVPSPPGIYALADQFGGVMFKRLEVVSKPSDDEVLVNVASDNPKHAARILPLDEIFILGRYIGKFSAG